MSWIAALITDYQLRRRQFVVACIGLLCGVAMFVAGAVDAVRGAPRGFVAGGLGFVMTIYFVRVVLREWNRMRAA